MIADQNKELQKLLMALDSLYAAGFPAEQIQETAKRLGVSRSA
mgnify:CR=1 FL=1